MRRWSIDAEARPGDPLPAQRVEADAFGDALTALGYRVDRVEVGPTILMAYLSGFPLSREKRPLAKLATTARLSPTRARFYDDGAMVGELSLAAVEAPKKRRANADKKS